MCGFFLDFVVVNEKDDLVGFLVVGDVDSIGYVVIGSYGYEIVFIVGVMKGKVVRVREVDGFVFFGVGSSEERVSEEFVGDNVL